MTRRVPDCVVYVEDSRLDDTGAALALADPVALDGLRVTWGRTTTVDQPEPAALSLTLLDPEGGASFLERFHVGDRVRVEATGPGWSESNAGDGDDAYGPNIITYGTFDDPAFPYALYAPVGNNDETAVRITEAPYRGAGAWTIRSKSARRFWNYLRPGPMALPGDPPGAWDGIPRFGAALNAWRIRVTYRAWHPSQGTTRPGGAALYPVFVSNPANTGGSSGANTGTIDLPGTGGQWVTVEGRVTLTANVGQAVKWLSAGVVLTPPSWAVPGTLGPTWAEADCQWGQVGRVDLDDLSIQPDIENEAGRATVLVFAGRVTDLDLALDDQQRPQVSVTATDVASELGNRVIGDEPWPAETVAQRCARILAAAGLTGSLSLFIDLPLRAVRVSFVDVDARDTLGLLQEVARSVDAVLWVAGHPTLGAYLRMEHMGSRAPLFALAIDPGGLVVIVPSGGDRVLRLSACDVLAEPVQFQQSVADVINTVALTWLEQTTDDETGQPAPTERNVIVRDAALVARLGTRRLSLTTILADQAPATATATAILGRASVGDWRASGLALDASLLSTPDLPTATRLLDGTARNGLPMFVIDLPTWAPAGTAASVYLEGGTYTYTEGAWRLELDVSAAQATGKGLPWSGVGPYAWRDFAPSVQWQDLAGVRPGPGI